MVSRFPLKTRVFPALALSTAVALSLSACTVEEGEDPDATVSGEASEPEDESAEPTVEPELTIDEMSEIIVPADDVAVSGAEDLDIEGLGNAPFSMYMTLAGIEPDGQCGDLLEEVNSYNVPSLLMAQGTYVFEDADSDSDSDSGSDESSEDADDGSENSDDSNDSDDSNEAEDEKSVQVLVFETEDEEDPMGVYPNIAEECGTLDNDEVDGASASFSQLGDLDAVQLTVDDGSGEEETFYTGGGSVGNHHVYLAATGMKQSTAEKLFEEQIERLEDQTDGGSDASASPSSSESSSPSSSGSPSPSESESASPSESPSESSSGAAEEDTGEENTVEEPAAEEPAAEEPAE